MINEVEDYAILMLSPDGIIQNWNLGAEKLKAIKLKRSSAKIFASFILRKTKIIKFRDAYPGSHSKRESQPRRLASEKGRQQVLGEVLLLLPCMIKQSNIIGFTKVTRDLTQRKLAEDNLRMYTKTAN
jgi:hypothetical protein